MLLLVNLTRSGSGRAFAAPPLALPSSGLAPRTKGGDPNRLAFSDPRTSVEAAANDYQSSSEIMLTANPQGGKNDERSSRVHETRWCHGSSRAHCCGSN